MNISLIKIDILKMPKDFFQFKQFIIHQSADTSVMKVCTDSCILGAYAEVQNTQNILDIGTGTGLLALMMAQRSSALIDAIEVEEAAYLLACKNVATNNRQAQISVYHQAIQDFALSIDKQYDLIVSNPPFFQNHLKSADISKNIALHNDLLSSEDLLIVVAKLLAEEGNFTVLMPVYQAKILVEKAKNFGLFLQKQLMIYHNELKKPFRAINTFGTKEEPFIQKEEWLIKDQKNQYSEDFKRLLKDYYLIF